jgi:hypothetical protein
MKGQRAQIGDVFEIATQAGLAYLQYTHRRGAFGVLVRVIEGIFAERPSDIVALVRAPTRFFVFYPVGPALNRGLIARVARAEVPTHAADFPILRVSGLRDPITKESDWWLWDGVREWHVGRLSEQEREFSVRSIVNHAMLVSMIASGWSPRDRR